MVSEGKAVMFGDNVFEVMTLEEARALKGRISPAVAAAMRNEASKVSDLKLRNQIITAVDRNNEELAWQLLSGRNGPLNSGS